MSADSQKYIVVLSSTDDEWEWLCVKANSYASDPNTYVFNSVIDGNNVVVAEFPTHRIVFVCISGFVSDGMDEFEKNMAGCCGGTEEGCCKDA